MTAPMGKQADSCQRCHEQEATITVRSEALCWSCFHKYVNTKIVKRMEGFRVRNAGSGKPRQYVLSMSLGAASVSLLHLLSRHLARQIEKTSNTGYAIQVVHVEMPGQPDGADTLAELKTRYPLHTYSTIVLSEILVSDPSVREVFSSSLPSEPLSPQEELTMLLASLSSASARADVLEVLRNRLLASYAKSHSCEGIFWGHSTTRLAERTLAETAKGRGFALPWLVNDGVSPEGLAYHYPMRELLTKEIIAYADSVEPPLPYIKHENTTIVSSRNATIDSLMQQYFQSAEQDYPAIVSNVVRTTGKLKPADLKTIEQQCELCELPLQDRAPERSRLCYGCIRSLG